MIYTITGGMFSGKTAKLIREMHKQEKKGKKVAVIVFSFAERDFGFENKNDDRLYSRDGSWINITFRVNNLKDLNDKLKLYDVIGVDEGQFSKNGFVEWCENLANEGKIVIVSGLITNIKMGEFSNMMKLLIISDKIKFLRAICEHCKEKASFTRKKVNDDGNFKIIDVGGSEKYEAVCRKCYNKFK